MTVHSPSHGNTNPAFADTVLLDVRLLDSVKTDTDVALEDFLIVVRAFRIDAETVRQIIRHAYCDYQTTRDLARAKHLPGYRQILRVAAARLRYPWKNAACLKGELMVKAIPDGYHNVTPYLIIRGASDAIEFYKSAFEAIETHRFAAPGGTIGHAEIRIGDSVIMLADEHPDMGYKGPQSLGGSPVSIMLYVENSDAVFNRAVAAGATVKDPVQDKFYGDRMGSIADPFGHLWHIATHKEDVSPQEMERRMKAMQA